MRNTERFAFPAAQQDFEAASLMPQLRLTLTYHEHSLTTTGLLDTGATVNAWPYPIRLEVGVACEAPQPSWPLSGNLTQDEISHLRAGPGPGADICDR